MQISVDKPLTDAEWDRLEEFLANCEGDRTMQIEELDGFLTALICGPELVMPSEYLEEIFDGPPDGLFKDRNEAAEILGLIMRRWNHLADGLNKGDPPPAVVMVDEKGNITGNDWASGFLVGVSMRKEAWAELFDFDGPGYLLGMMFFDHEHDPDPEMRPSPLSPEKREELLHYMFAAPLGIYEHFKSRRAQEKPRETTGRSGKKSKIGRNEPCPCGSGKKYKQCRCSTTQ